MILRVKFTKENYLKYISHLDLMRLFQRTFRRANIPINYSEGFNPQPKFSIANPLALGIESIEEYMDIDLYRSMAVEDFIERMNEELPEDIRVKDAKYTEDNRSISSLICWSYYEIEFIANKLENKEKLKEMFSKWLEKDKIIIKKIKRKGKKITERDQNIKPLIGSLTYYGSKESFYYTQNDKFLGHLETDRINITNEGTCFTEYKINLHCILKAGDNGNLKPTDFVEAIDRDLDLGIDYDSLNIKRLKLFTEGEEKIESPL